MQTPSASTSDDFLRSQEATPVAGFAPYWSAYATDFGDLCVELRLSEEEHVVIAAPVSVTWVYPSLREFPGTETECIEWSEADCSGVETTETVAEFVARMQRDGLLPADTALLDEWRKTEGDVSLWQHQGELAADYAASAED